MTRNAEARHTQRQGHRNAVETSAAAIALEKGMEPSKEVSTAVGPLASSDSDSEHGTPEQQAAWSDMTNGWYRDRVLEALAVTGNIEDAARVAGINPRTVYRAQNDDPEFAAGLQLARRRFGQRALGKATAAFMAADPEQLVKTPTLGIAVVNWYNPELRPNAVTIDARHQTVNVLDPQTAEAVARALSGVVDGELA